jgi:rhodanese-related sulfurtransferase
MKHSVRAVGAIPLMAMVLGGCVKQPQPSPPAPTSAPAKVVKQPVTEPKKVAKPAAAAAAEKKPAGKVTMMPLEEFLPLQQGGGALIYDARPSFVRAFGHVPGSVGWPRSSVQIDWAVHEPELKAAVAANKPVVIYCTDLECPDAKFVADKVAARGYSVFVLTGGYAAWKEAGLAVE